MSGTISEWKRFNEMEKELAESVTVRLDMAAKIAELTAQLAEKSADAARLEGELAAANKRINQLVGARARAVKTYL